VINRRERAGDEAPIHAIHALAFRRADTPDREPPEAKLVDDLRASDDWIPGLSLVALDGQEIVGHVVCSRGLVVPSTPVLGLGPLGVRPDHQRGGIGQALVHAVLGAADAMDEPLVALLGSPVYYARFGFVRSTAVGIDPPQAIWGDHFQVRTLSSYEPTITGTFRYAKAFDAVDDTP
jgi:putative acetyltransferase